MALLSLGLSSCQETERESLAPEEAEWSITVTASIPTAPVVRSEAAPGDGTSANRCILEVYENDVFSGARYVAPVQDMGAVFEDVHLIAGGSYELVLWADCAEKGQDGGYSDIYYNTEAFPEKVSIIPETFAGNDDARDAFFGSASVTAEALAAGTAGVSAELRRPFGQLNIYSKDYAMIPVETMRPAAVKITFGSVYTSVDLTTGEPGDPAEMSYVSTVDVIPAFSTGDDNPIEKEIN